LRCQRNIADHAVTGPGARRFMMPAPVEMLRALVESGKLNAEEARLAARVPLATDLTVEADSGGLYRQRAADGRPAHDHQAARRTGRPVWLGTPSSVPAAFALGAAYVLTGSINQSAIESGLSDQGKRMLAEAGIGDVGMAAAADMFELGVKLQVLNRGTMFSVRANKLYELYRDHASLEAIPAAAGGELETKILGATIDTGRRDPSQAEKARADAKHRMALVFRWYLGKSSRWAIAGESPPTCGRRWARSTPGWRAHSSSRSRIAASSTPSTS
jgi:trans-AT polyketide synthase/acyltransferase/oxidoreductase domain-containing protein